MNSILLRILICAAFTAISAQYAMAQQQKSTSSGITRRDAASAAAKGGTTGSAVTERMQSRMERGEVSDADKAWMRVIYRRLDLDKPANAPLYYPVEADEGEENLFRIIVGLLASNKIPAYEFLDGREVFTDKYRITPRDIFDNYQISYTEAKGSTAQNPLYVVDENDVPANEVLSYYIIERWEFDRRNNHLDSHIEALCPVIHRVQDYATEASRYPVCWIRYADLRPYLTDRSIFTDDNNNLPTGNYDDYFTLGKYDGEIYKTRNLRNRTMAELYPDPEALKHAQDSIQRSLDNFEKNLWVPSLEELQARSAASDSVKAADPSTKSVARSSRSTSRRAAKAKPKKAPKVKTEKASRSAGAVRSVRNRRR